MPTLTTRSLIKFGDNGLVLTIPKAWIDYYQLKPGDKLEVIANGKLTIRPLKKSETIEINLPRVIHGDRKCQSRIPSLK